MRDLARAMAQRDDTALVSYTDKARRQLVAFLAWLEPQMRRDAPLGGTRIRPWASKLGGHVVRLSAALHVAEHGLGAVNRPIEDVSVRGAIVLGRYYLEHAVAAHAPAGQAGAEDGRAVLTTLLTAATTDGRRKFIGPFRVRDLHRSMQRRFPMADDLKAVIDDLVHHGWLRLAEGDKSAFEVHPDAGRHLYSGDSGDSGDSDGIAAGGAASATSGTVSPQPLTAMTTGASSPLSPGVLTAFHDVDLPRDLQECESCHRCHHRVRCCPQVTDSVRELGHAEGRWSNPS